MYHSGNKMSILTQARVKVGAKGAAASGPAVLRVPTVINMCVVELSDGGLEVLTALGLALALTQPCSNQSNTEPQLL